MTDRIISKFAWSRHHFRALEINGGRLTVSGQRIHLSLQAQRTGYGDAQFDDLAAPGATAPTRWRRRVLPWRPGTRLRLRARFSHGPGRLQGTAGFGFWNAPFGDPTIWWPALPQAVWYFYGSRQTNLPLAPTGPGTGWFAATVDASSPGAWTLAPLAPFVLLCNQIPSWRQRFWPRIQRRLGMSYATVGPDPTVWHTYELIWLPGGCQFSVDEQLILSTDQSPRGPLGFVCWLDNQYLTLTATGRFAFGWIEVPESQWLEVADLQLESTTG